MASLFLSAVDGTCGLAIGGGGWASCLLLPDVREYPPQAKYLRGKGVTLVISSESRTDQRYEDTRMRLRKETRAKSDS